MWTNWLEWTFWPTMMDGIVLYINVKTDDKKENPANGKRYKINNIKTCMQQRGAPSLIRKSILTIFRQSLIIFWQSVGTRGVLRDTCHAAAWRSVERLHDTCMLVHDKVFALRACERRTGSRARRGEHGARSRAWLQQALTGEQQQYLHTISTLSTAWAGRACLHNFRIYPKPGPQIWSWLDNGWHWR